MSFVASRPPILACPSCCQGGVPALEGRKRKARGRVEERSDKARAPGCDPVIPAPWRGATQPAGSPVPLDFAPPGRGDREPLTRGSLASLRSACATPGFTIRPLRGRETAGELACWIGQEI